MSAGLADLKKQGFANTPKLFTLCGFDATNSPITVLKIPFEKKI